MKSVVVIPARYSSSRYPGKPLVRLLGKPMILWVAELAAKAVGKCNVFVATDDERIANTVEHAGFNSVMTSTDALTGTDRIAEVISSVSADIYVNVQGDEPLVSPDDIIKVIEYKKQNMHSVINAYCWISTSEDPESPNIPKVITTESNQLVYMSRRALPGFKDERYAPEKYKKQVCIYAFTADELACFRAFGRKSTLEHSEDIEILRFLELNKSILMIETEPGSLAVDTPEDVPPVEHALSRRAGNAP